MCTNFSALHDVMFAFAPFPHSKKQPPVLGNAIPVLGVNLKQGYFVFWQFFHIDLCIAISMESCRRDLLNDMAEHGPILKNNQNTYYLRFSFTPETGAIP